MTADVVTFKLKQGRWTYPKDPNDQEFYGVDCTDQLPPGATIGSLATGAPADPTAVVAGVTVLIPPRIQGTTIVVKLGGLNTSPLSPNDNKCTITYYASTGEQFHRSIYFTEKDK